jgi:hypothetical protein
VDEEDEEEELGETVVDLRLLSKLMLLQAMEIELPVVGERPPR